VARYCRRLSTAAALLALVFPFLGEWKFELAGGPVSGVTDLITLLSINAAKILEFTIPGYGKPWIESFRAHPVALGAIVLLNIGLWHLGNRIDRQIRELGLALHQTGARMAASRARRKPIDRSITRVLCTVAGILLLGLLLSLTVFFAREVHDYFHAQACIFETCERGWGDEISDALSGIVLDAIIPGLAWIITAVIFFFVAITISPLIWWSVSTRKLASRSIHKEYIPTFVQTIIRTFSRRQLISEVPSWAIRALLPPLFALGIVASSLLVLNQISFAVLSASGAVCRSKELLKEKGLAEVSRNDGCGKTGIGLKAGQAYELTASPFELGSDNEKSYLHWDAEYPDQSSRFFAPSLRKPFAGALTPILRIGSYGLTETTISPRALWLGICVVPRQTGELFIFENDYIIGVPRVWNQFYRGQPGKFEVSVSRFKNMADCLATGNSQQTLH
jgi:hypothetical protein